MTTELLLSSAINEIGQRTNNEDSVFPNSEINSALHNLFLVCDGVGGHAKGEIASDLVCSQLARYYEQERIDISTPELIERGIQFVENQFDSYMLSNPDSAGMGTTLTLLHLHRRGASLAHIGDSRIYHLRGGEILYRSKDHSYVQTLVDLGEITEEEAARHPNRNQITNAIQGASVRRAKPSQHSITDLRAGDLFILCTDGVLESVTDEDMRAFSREGYEVDTIALKMRRLCEGQSRDNFSAYIVKLTEAYIQSLELPQAGAMPSPSAVQPSSLERTLIDVPQEGMPSSREAAAEQPTLPSPEAQAEVAVPAGEAPEWSRANAEPTAAPAASDAAASAPTMETAPSAPSLDEAASHTVQAERPHTQICSSAEGEATPTPSSPPAAPASAPVPPPPTSATPPPPSAPNRSAKNGTEPRRIPMPGENGSGISPKYLLFKGIAGLSTRTLLYIGAACVGLLLALGAIFYFKSGGEKQKGNAPKSKQEQIEEKTKGEKGKATPSQGTKQHKSLVSKERR